MKGIWGEPNRKYYWEASLMGDLVCGYCQHTRPVPQESGPLPCSSCGKKDVDLTDEIMELAQSREKAAFPNGRPAEREQKWKGDDPYGS